MISLKNGLDRSRLLRNPRLVATIFGLVVSCVVANGMYSVDETIQTEDRLRTAQLQSPNTYPIDNISMNLECKYWTMGWPFKFYSIVDYPGLPALHSFSWARLAANLVAWVLVGLCIASYLRLSRPSKTAEPTNTSARTGQVKLLDLFVIMTLFAVAAGYWRLWENRKRIESKLAMTIVEKGGAVETQIVVPAILRQLLPQEYLLIFSRITAATLESPSNELLEQVLSVPELRCLRLGGGDYDLNKLAKLRTIPFLRELRVSGRDLDGEAVASIGSCKQLLCLNLMRTNISNDGIKAISDLPRLRSLNLVHTTVSFSKIGKPTWAQTVQDLFLPHPGREATIDTHLGDGVCEKHVIRGWPELRLLRCIEHDESENARCVDLEIAECPKLVEIGLDAFQRFDLKLSDLSELTQVSAEIPQWVTRLSTGVKTGRNVFLRKLNLHNVPKLASVQVTGKGLEDLALQTAGLQLLKISTAYFRSPMALKGEGTSRQLRFDDGSSLAVRQNWIDQIGQNVGPTKADLSWLTLTNVNLAPLANNSGLKELDLSHSYVTENQLLQLAGSKSLERIELLGTELSGASLAKVLSKLNSLKHLRTNSRNLRLINLEAIENVQRIFHVQEPRDFERLRLVSMPNLQETFEARSPLRSCQLVGIPSVRGLSFQSHLPRNTKIEGLRDLQFFSAGGPTLTDTIVSEVLACKQLKSLTLAYASNVSSHVLAQIVDLSELEYLSIPGCKIDTAFVQSLHKLKKLRGIVLDDTSVSDESFAGVDLIDIKQFSVNRTQVTDQLIQKILAKPTLTHIGLAGLDVSTSTIEKIVKCMGLEWIDLSDTALDSRSWAALSKFDTEKKTLFLFRNAKVDFKTVKKLMIDNRSIRLDLTDAIDPITNEDSYSLSQHLLNSMSYNDLERVFDTWHPKELSERFMIEDPDEMALQGQRNDGPSRMPGEIFTFLFSPDWK
jgi:hypothetical protein